MILAFDLCQLNFCQASSLVLFVRKNTEIELTNYENLTDVKTMKNYRNIFALVQFCILMAIDDKKMSWVVS